MRLSPRSFLLLIGDDGAFLLPPDEGAGGAALPVLAPSHDVAETQALMAELTAAAGAPVHLIYDGGDQAYEQQALPPLSLFDRRKLLARRLKETFEDRLLTGFILNKNRRAATLMAVRENEALTLWQERLKGRENPAELVSLLPVELAPLLARLAPESASGWGLLLLLHKTGGLRLIATRDGAFFYTRLTAAPAPSASAGLAASTLGLEVKVVRDYLARFGLTPEEPLTLVAVLGHAGWRESLAVTPMPVTSRRILTPHEAAQALSLAKAPASAEAFADSLSLLWIKAQGRTQSALMTPKARREKGGRLVRLWGTRAAAAGVALALLCAAWDGVGLVRTGLALRAAQKETTQLERAFLALQEETALGGGEDALSHLRLAIERERLFTCATPEPLVHLQALAPLLQERARVMRLSWEGGRLALTLKLTGAGSGQTDLEKEQASLLADEILSLVQKRFPDLSPSLSRQEEGQGSASGGEALFLLTLASGTRRNVP